MIKWNKRERKKEIECSKGLGYGAKAPEYEALNTDIATLEKQLKGNADASSVFAKLEDKLSGFLKRRVSPTWEPERYGCAFLYLPGQQSRSAPHGSGNLPFRVQPLRLVAVRIR